MQNAFFKKRALSPILIAAAILALGFVLFFTLRSSSDPVHAEIEDFGYQTISGDTLESNTTSLRFLFTVGSLNYNRVGFVFSKTNRTPTVNGDGCRIYETEFVYSSVWANGEKITANDGRHWVVVQLSNIPKSYFESAIYVRPFVDNGEIVYGAAKNLGVEAAFLVPGLKDDVAGFGGSDFGTGSIRTDLGGSYAIPSKHPTVGQHPRVLFTSESIDGLSTALADAKQVAKDGYAAALDSPPDGILANDEFDSTDTAILRDIQTLALDYQRTGNLLSGYRAIYAIKNVLKTLGTNWTNHDDVAHRYYGFAMYITACVYDWCYDLLTPTDRDQIVLGVQEKICKVGMTVNYAVGFPPLYGDAVSGHGTGFMILRDYLAFAIAIYDEYPGWWNMIAGRFYEEYVPVRNEIYKAGMVPQGVSLYVRSKFFPELFSAWLIKAATGSFPYASEENMKQVARTIFSYELRVNNKVLLGFPSGDDQVPYGMFLDYGHIALLSSYLFNDETMRAQLEYNYNAKEDNNHPSRTYGSSYRNFSGDVTETASIAEYLICSSSGVEAAEDRHTGMDLILYNGGWLGQIIARNTWERSQATVLMKIGVRTVANHDHYDAGSFQIFYKSMLAGDAGVYDGYGSNHHMYYHQATIAHNSLLIYNTSRSSTDGGYYSGGQARLDDASLSNWQSNTYKTGEVTGVSYGYDGSTPVYAYLAGDIAAAYPSSTVSEVTRRMLVVYDTGNDKVPMYFFVFDNITAVSGNYKKTFLLHTKTEPEIPDGYTASDKIYNVYNGSGMLRIQNVIGNNVTVTPRGGNGSNYLVNKNGVNNYVQLTSTNEKDDNYWGRLEISPATGNATDQLLNAMYVCDNEDGSPDLVATAIDDAVVKGAVLGNTAAVFVTSKTRRTTEFSFTAPGEGYLNYYVSGVAAGNWLVQVGGKTVTYGTATAEGGFLTFTAPAGTTVTLRPGTPNIEIVPILPEDGWDSFNFSSAH